MNPQRASVILLGMVVVVLALGVVAVGIQRIAAAPKAQEVWSSMQLSNCKHIVVRTGPMEG